MGRQRSQSTPRPDDAGPAANSPDRFAAPPADRPSLDDAYVRYRGAVVNLLRDYLDADDVEDAAQDVFAEAWRAWERFDPGRFRLRAWLVGIARHVALDRQSSNVRQRELAARLERQVAADGGDAPRLEADSQAEIRDAVLGLPSRTRRIILMRYVLGYSRAEIGAALGMSEAAVAKRIHRTLRLLRRQVDGADGGALQSG